MKIKKIICLLILGTQIGCVPTTGIVQVKPDIVKNNTEKQTPVVTKSVEPTSGPIVKESLQPDKDGIAGTKQSGDVQNLPSPSPTPIPSKYPCAGNIGGECVPIIPYKINNPYSVANPVPPEARSGSISLIFHDQFKVRYEKTQNKFISLTGYDTSNINVLISEYKPVKIYSDIGVISEEEAEQREKRLEASNGYDYHNDLSACQLNLENINIKEFVEKLRADNLVRSANLNLGGGPG